MNRVREFRKAQGLAQLALAVRAGLSPATLVAVERYDYRPTAGVRNRIAAALGREADEVWPLGGLDDHCASI